MHVDDTDLALLAAIEDGLPLVARPYAAVGERIGIAETEVIERLKSMRARGVIRRFGLIVRHHELGFNANAMIVWNIPDAEVDRVAEGFAGKPFVTLCYRRPRRGVDWPYNLFCMIHGRDREAVEDQVAMLAEAEDWPHAILFSRRRFKQRGARFSHARLEARP